MGASIPEVMRELGNAIREKQQRILALKREIAALEAELKEARAILSERPRGDALKTRTRPIRPNSSVWWTHKVLVQAGKPLHIDEIVKRVGELAGLTVRKSTLVSNLSRYVKQGDTFMRPEDGTYGLLPHP
jgi:hypothetical protein